tara:strand:+ start:688 stop:1116 length:429 start_codon:yes stop_codon:yes gene_type:complete
MIVKNVLLILLILSSIKVKSYIEFRGLEEFSSEKRTCNVYVSPRFCRPCVPEVSKKLKLYESIDTLFIVSSNNNYIEIENLKRIMGEMIQNIPVKDTIYSSYTGDVYSKETKTNFGDSCLNNLFKRSTPFIFKRSGCSFNFL